MQARSSRNPKVSYPGGATVGESPRPRDLEDGDAGAGAPSEAAVVVAVGVDATPEGLLGPEGEFHPVGRAHLLNYWGGGDWERRLSD